MLYVRVCFLLYRASNFLFMCVKTSCVFVFVFPLSYVCFCYYFIVIIKKTIISVTKLQKKTEVSNKKQHQPNKRTNTATVGVAVLFLSSAFFCAYVSLFFSRRVTFLSSCFFFLSFNYLFVC